MASMGHHDTGPPPPPEPNFTLGQIVAISTLALSHSSNFIDCTGPLVPSWLKKDIYIIGLHDLGMATHTQKYTHTYYTDLVP